jgi:hypothetical protein
MRTQVRFPILPWGFFLEGEDFHRDHGLGSLAELRLRPLLVLHIYVSPFTLSGQRNCASWASQLQKSVTLRPPLGGETTKSIRCTWWLLGKKNFVQILNTKFNSDWFIGCWKWLWNTGQETVGGWRKSSIIKSFIISAVKQIHVLSQWSIVFLHPLVHFARGSLNTLRSYSSRYVGLVSLAVRRVCAFLTIFVLFVWRTCVFQFTVCKYSIFQLNVFLHLAMRSSRWLDRASWSIFCKKTNKCSKKSWIFYY